MPGTLFIVATPIGNLGDLTKRAAEVLASCDRVAAEDTRRSLKLLNHLGIAGKRLDSLHAHSDDRDVARLVEALERGESIALVTDAGTPAVSDPGGALVKMAIRANIPVVPIPGASAVLAALVASGLATDSGFRFVAFLPRDGEARADAIAKVRDTPEPVVIFESPERTVDTLRDLADVMPTRDACVARELTKMHEEILRGTLTDLAKARDAYQGEVVLVLGARGEVSEEIAIDDAAVDARIDEGLASGLHAKTIAARVAAWSGRSKRDIYERVIARKTGN